MNIGESQRTKNERKQADAAGDDPLSRIEEVAVREFVREFAGVFSKDHDELIAQLVEADESVSNPPVAESRGKKGSRQEQDQEPKQASIAAAYVRLSHPSKKLLKEATNAAIKVLEKKWDNISAHFAKHEPKEKHHVLEFIARVIKKHRPGFLEKVTAVWRDSASVDQGLRDGFKPGLYQLIRRYKLWTDTDDPQEQRDYFDDSDNHFVVIELLYVDMDRLECLLVNCEGHVHIGSIFINRDAVQSQVAFLNIVLMRQKDASALDVRQRYLTLRFGKQVQPYYSGISIKLGDRSGRLVSSDLLLQRVPNAEHGDVYRACKEIYERMSEAPALIYEAVAPDSVVHKYITSNPPEDLSDGFAGSEGAPQLSNEWKDKNRIRQVKDIEGLSALARPSPIKQAKEIEGQPDLMRPLQKTGVVRFAEPSRTLKASFLRNLKVPLFEWPIGTPPKA